MLEGPPFASELAQIVDEFQRCSFPTVFRSTKIPARRVSFSATPPRSISPKIQSYASTAASPKVASSSVTVAPKADAQSQRMVPVNRKGQRIDPPLKPSRTATEAIKGRKLCNNYYLLGVCNFLGCQYEHGLINEAQKMALRLYARQQACEQGLGCDDPDCYFGHQCPWDPCLYEYKSCRFSPEMHRVDKKVVN